MKEDKIINLGDLFLRKGKSINPEKFKEEEFDLLSIPAYDRGEPDVLFGKEIGSSKKLLKSGDVVISRIIPHIRRCWVVPEFRGRRQIGSSEWIVFRSDKFDSKFLKYYLLSDLFNGMFMRTVRGVGGSLLRANPKLVEKFKILLPPLKTQKAIAAILDEADRLRRLNRELTEKYDALTQSLFHEMFGDPVINEKKWSLNKLDDLTSKITDGEHGTVKRLEEGKMYLMARNVGHEGLTFDDVSYISEEAHKKIYKRCNPEKGDLLIVCVGATIGRCCLVDKISDFSLARSVALIKPEQSKLNSLFLLHQFKNIHFQKKIMSRRNTSAQAGLYTGQIKKLKIIVPPLHLQTQFAERINIIETQKAQAKAALQKSEDLFNALLQQAFKGELTAAETA